MAKIIDNNSSRKFSGWNASNDFTITATPITTQVSGTSSGTATVKDALFNTFTGATIRNVCQYTVSQPLTLGSVTLTNLTTGVGTLGSDGTVTRITDGTMIVQGVAKQGTKKVSFPISQTGGVTNSVFSNYVSGTCANAVATTLDGLISGKTASTTTYNLFSTLDNTNRIYTRNTSLFASSIDWTSLAASYGGGNQFGGTMISPLHFVTAYHNLINGNAAGTLYFSDASNTVTSRTVTSGNWLRVGATDIAIVKLDSAVASGINFAKVLPSNLATKLPQLQYRVPAVFSNQHKELHVVDWTGDTVEALVSTPTDSTRLAFNTPIIVGDSSSPVYIIVGTTPVLIGCWHTAISCSMIADNISGINTAMSTLGGGYSLTTVDLSAYTSF